jgi:alpha-L-fucosidase 2
MHWQEAKLVKVILKSKLGGNLRVRVPNQLKFSEGEELNLAVGKNQNLFYQVKEVADPVVSEKANIELAALKETIVYDIITQPQSVYTLIQK